MLKLNSSYRHTFLFGFAILAFQVKSPAQYNLPKSPILAEFGVKTISVTKTALRMENWEKEDVTPDSFDRTTRPIANYFVNSNGQIDSIYYYTNDSCHYKKSIYIYNSSNQLVEKKTISCDGEINERVLVEHTVNNQLYIRHWHQNVLYLEMRTTADSIILETIQHRQYEPEHMYMKYEYDMENDIARETWYHGDRVVKMESKQWISENGIPKRLIFKTIEQTKKMNKPKMKTHELQVDLTGVVINKLNGLIFDPFRLDNYFERHERFQDISYPDHSILREDRLVTEYEIPEILSFDGKSIICLYQIKYE